MAEDQTGSNSKRMIVVAIFALVGLLGVSALLEPNSTAPESTNPQTERQAESDQTEQDESEESNRPSQDDSPSEVRQNQADKYTYTATSGDSYTYFARQAVAIAGPALTPAERVAAETRLTQAAGQPSLEIGQTVNIEASQVEAAIAWAKGLSQTQKAAWQPYADMVILPSIK